MTWVKDLMARHFIDRESGTAPIKEDPQSDLGFNTAAGRQYRSSTSHSSFIRPVCQTIKPRSIVPRRREIEREADGDVLRTASEKQVDHIMLFMPFLHFETSEGYDRMFEVISEIKREKEREVWKKRRQMTDEPPKKEAEKEQATGKERDESLRSEGKSSLEY
ncbi:hypothetical protein BGZ57DRAFT_19717 [Hyaloscypha finlandica]|nr:hypothetical protein BGZ57DRAFT_19717 [Hyaloscypha finlandica]